MLRLTPAPEHDPIEPRVALPFLMMAVVATMVALFTGDVLYALGIAAVIGAGAVVGWAFARRRQS